MLCRIVTVHCKRKNPFYIWHPKHTLFNVVRRLKRSTSEINGSTRDPFPLNNARVDLWFGTQLYFFYVKYWCTFTIIQLILLTFYDEFINLLTERCKYKQ